MFFIACDIVKTPLMPTGGDIKPGVAMTNVLSRMATRRHDHVQNGLSLGRSQVKIMPILHTDLSKDSFQI